MAVIGIIGGSGFYDFPEIETPEKQVIETPYGSVNCTKGKIGVNVICFIARHGGSHNVLPHLVNYRANIAALKQMQVEEIIALNAVGSITEDFPPGIFVLPDQIVDYTYGRDHTFVDSNASLTHHIDFSYPFSRDLKQRILLAIQATENQCKDGGVYACTQGPRLETAAEIKRLAQDGCNLVGMTMMPEAALARELSIAYASICLPVNWAAGVTKEVITIEAIMAQLSCFNSKLREVLHTFCISQ
ncbi:S-methyl-5'-thioinosine phosphorylase [Thalassocella blandensis]|nr:S-methyl-5'-thioinosine phosphorylase [Thalassocella blandensis]